MQINLWRLSNIIYALIIIRNNLLVQSLEKLDIRRLDRLDSFSKKGDNSLNLRKARNEEIDRVSTRENFAYSRHTIIISGTILDVSCSRCAFLGCGGRNVHDTKRAETLSRNRNEVWSLQSVLPEKREEGREESREKQRGAHASRLHRGIRWLDSSRERIHALSCPQHIQERCGIFARLLRVDVQMTYFHFFFISTHFKFSHTRKFWQLIFRDESCDVLQRKLSAYDVQIEYSTGSWVLYKISYCRRWRWVANVDYAEMIEVITFHSLSPSSPLPPVPPHPC